MSETGQDGAAEAAQLGADERQRLRRAHERLRAASKDLESLIATEPIKNRWEPEPAPPEILAAAREELAQAWERVVACQRDLLGWEAVGGE